MDNLNIIQVINDNPVCYFLAGLVLGYALCSYKSRFKGKKTSRYERKAIDPANRPELTAEVQAEVQIDEPPFDWAVAAAAVKTITTARASQTVFDQQNNGVM